MEANDLSFNDDFDIDLRTSLEKTYSTFAVASGSKRSEAENSSFMPKAMALSYKNPSVRTDIYSIYNSHL